MLRGTLIKEPDTLLEQEIPEIDQQRVYQNEGQVYLRFCCALAYSTMHAPWFA